MNVPWGRGRWWYQALALRPRGLRVQFSSPPPGQLAIEVAGTTLKKGSTEHNSALCKSAFAQIRV